MTEASERPGVRLPAHITEEDIRAITRIVAPELIRAAWNSALDAALEVVDRVDSHDEVPLSVAYGIEGLRRPEPRP